MDEVRFLEFKGKIYEKISKFDDIIVIFICIGFLASGIGIGMTLIPYLEDIKTSEIAKANLGLNCSTGSIISDSECLNREFSTFFYYNISQIGKDISEEELIKEGGVCSHATEWFSKRMKDRGYYVKSAVIKVNSTMGHEFLITSNKDAYCILDQMIMQCFNF